MMKNGCKGVIEGTTMPCTEDAVTVFQKHKTLYVPWKAANGGAVRSKLYHRY